MQEAYFSAFVNLNQFAGEARISTWLTKIAVYEALGRIRRRKRMDEMPENLSSNDSPERAAYGKELQTAIESAIDALPPLYRGVFVLREIEEMSGSRHRFLLGNQRRDGQDTSPSRSSTVAPTARAHLGDGDERRVCVWRATVRPHHGRVMSTNPVTPVTLKMSEESAEYPDRKNNGIAMTSANPRRSRTRNTQSCFG